MSTPLKILYLAAGGAMSTSMMKARALQRLGHTVTTINLNDRLPANIWLRRLNNITGYAAGQGQVARFVESRVAGQSFDLAWVDSGHMAGPRVIKILRKHASRVLNYNHDDPTGTRDGRVWGSFRRAVPFYDLLVTVRPETEAELRALGARCVRRVWRSYDEVEHRRRDVSAAELAKWSSEVVFIGTWMPERGAFMAELVQRGVPLAIHGDFWPKAREWPVLQAVWRGPAVYGEDYARAIQCSKIALGLLSKGNRDRHTTRTAEIPALAGLLCAERTDEHLQLFREGEEAVFWADATECATVCAQLLADERKRASIRQRGWEKVVALGLGHEKVLGSIIQQLILT